MYWFLLNTPRPQRNGNHYAGDILKRLFCRENCGDLNNILLKFVPKHPIDDNSSLVEATRNNLSQGWTIPCKWAIRPQCGNAWSPGWNLIDNFTWHYLFSKRLSKILIWWPNESAVKRQSTLDQYTAPNTQYTGCESPHAPPPQKKKKKKKKIHVGAKMVILWKCRTVTVTQSTINSPLIKQSMGSDL